MAAVCPRAAGEVEKEKFVDMYSAAGQRQPVGVRLVTLGPCAAARISATPFPPAVLPAAGLTDAKAFRLPLARGAASAAGYAPPAFSGSFAVMLLTFF